MTATTGYLAAVDDNADHDVGRRFAGAPEHAPRQRDARFRKRIGCAVDARGASAALRAGRRQQRQRHQD
jgi:hypothetical protein